MQFSRLNSNAFIIVYDTTKYKTPQCQTVQPAGHTVSKTILIILITIFCLLMLYIHQHDTGIPLPGLLQDSLNQHLKRSVRRGRPCNGIDTTLALPF